MLTCVSLQVAKKLVNSDFKNNRVDDPTNIDDKQQKKVKKYCKEYFDKAVIKYRVHEKKKKTTDQQGRGADDPKANEDAAVNGESEDEGVDVKMSDDEGDKPEEDSKDTPGGTEGAIELGGSLKRKRDEFKAEDDGNGSGSLSPSKRQRSSTPPPPPPPPPIMSPDANEEQDEEEPDEMIQVGDNLTTKGTIPPPPPPPPLSEQNGNGDAQA